MVKVLDAGVSLGYTYPKLKINRNGTKQMTTFYAKSHNGRWITNEGTSHRAQEAKGFRTRRAAEKAMMKSVKEYWADETTGIYTIDFSRPETPETRV